MSQAPPVETQFVPDAPAGADEQTQHVPELPRFGRFRALAQVGAGAMGTVYRASDDVLGRAVAIKTLNGHAGAELRERFLHEVRAIGAVVHPNILGIYDAGTEAGAPYLVMELAAGGSLRERMQARTLTADDVRTIGIQIARALAAAHAADILHRDVKPANILAVQGDVWKLADFGIARLPDSTLTATGQFIGSPSYAAPESLRAGLFSPASDVYGLGATLYEALAGAPPHGDHEMRSVIRRLDEDPPPLPARCAVPGPLGEAVMAAVARDPVNRPSAAELARLLAATEVESRPVPAWSRATQLASIGFAVAAVALLVTVVLHRERAVVALPAPATTEAELVRSDAAPSIGPTPAPSVRAQPSASPEPSAPAEPSAPVAPEPAEPAEVDASEDAHAMIFDEPEPVDEATARAMLEQLEQEARAEYERIDRARGRFRRHGRSYRRGD